jgi:gliding motility-associated-like protein
MQNLLLPRFLFCFISINAFSQQLIINEVSQGTTGEEEYVELLVIPGNKTYNCTDYCLDLQGWIIDDNNGYFSGGGGSGLGIANGAVRFKNDPFWQCIPIGTLIVIYNNGDRNGSLPLDDLSKTDGNYRLIIPVTSNLLESHINKPTTSNPSYSDTDWTSPPSKWDPLGMSNDDDSFQLYKPNPLSTSIPVHGVSWGNNNKKNIIYFSGGASDKVFCFSNDVSDNPFNQNNWTTASCLAQGTQTPGLPNNAKNAAYIESLTTPLKGELISASASNSGCCNGSAVVSASGSIPGYTYNWYSKPTNLPINVPNDSQKASSLCPGDYYCVVKSSINCVETVFFTINLDPNGQKLPTFNPIPPICAGENLILPTESTNFIKGIWSPPIDNTKTTIYTFTPDANQCANSINVMVDVNPVPQISINENPTICQGENTKLTTKVDLTGGSYLWTPTGETLSEITITPQNTTTYTVVYKLNGCESQPSEVKVSVKPSVLPNFNPKGPFCQDAILPQVLLPETSNNGITGTWNPPMLSTEVSGDISYTFNPNQGQCASPFTLIVKVYPAAPIDAGTDVLVCSGSTIKLTATGGTNYLWTGGIQNGQSFIPVKTEKYFVIGQGANGCESSDSVSVVVIEQPEADYSSDVVTGIAPLTVNFTNSSLKASEYLWNFGDGNNKTSNNLSSVSNVYSNPGSYTVWLYAKNNPCIDSTSKTIVVTEAPKVLLKIPNVFSPNGDGSNDEWFITNENISELTVHILNRWGTEISKIETVNGAWNGKTADGSDALEGVYFFKYEAKGIDTSTYNGQGFIALIR